MGYKLKDNNSDEANHIEIFLINCELRMQNMVHAMRMHYSRLKLS